MKQIIQTLVTGKGLSREEASRAMDLVLDNGATPAQISAFLTLLRTKGETVDEIIGCASILKKKACHIHPTRSNYLDMVGTGGDGSNTFNISTTAAFVAAAAGIPIAKHGNRAISSRSGSVDVLEALGIAIALTPEQVETCVNDTGLGFMYARTFHKSMKNVSSVRSELGIRTIFNILGPISNPSDAKFQVIGVFSEDLTHPLANAMMNMGVQRGMVMCCNGIDEFTTAGPTKVSEIKNGESVEDYLLSPQDMGFSTCQPGDLTGGTAEENAAVTLDILNGQKGPKRDTVLMNAGAAVYIQGGATTFQEGIAQAATALDTGKAYEKLQELINYTQKIGKE